MSGKRGIYNVFVSKPQNLKLDTEKLFKGYLFPIVRVIFRQKLISEKVQQFYEVIQFSGTITLPCL